MHVKKDMLRVYCAADNSDSRDRCMMKVVDIPKKFTTQGPSQLATGNYTNNQVQSLGVALLVCITVLPLSSVIIITTLAFCCCYQRKKIKALQRLNQTMRDNNNTTPLPLATVSRPGQCDQYMTPLNLQFHSRNNTPAITEPQYYTESDLPPSYSSLFVSQVEQPSYTILTDNYERYGFVYYSPCVASNELPPPYSSSV
ncbi:uncharacterized protein LOC131934800 [Physella acuta]|uniref:uncharacterized protein LOC131934800 n=1 Tax=Physella acuta TaxID=109671 RepID=UPI0027DD1828|nr:uncharacterized protein LOC131934800 [Physella acuta]